MPPHRYHDPDRLLGAANFSDEDQLRGSLNTVKLIKSQPWVWGQLREACELEVQSLDGRPFDPGLAVRVIDSVADPSLPRGTALIAETLSPLILWRGQVVKAADVVVKNNLP